MANYRLRRVDPHTGKPTPQWGFWNSRAKLQVFGGAFANGKTTAMSVKAVKLITDYPGSNGLMARSTYPKLNDTLRKVFLEWCPPDLIRRKPTQEDNTCYMHNGTVVNFRYIAQRGKQNVDGSTTSNLLSATYDWIIVDQIEDPEIGHKDFLDLMGRLRGSTLYRPEDESNIDETMPLTGPRFMMVSANPTSNWFYQEIVKPYLLWRDHDLKTPKLLWDEEHNKPLMELFEGDTYSNRDNLPPDYIKSLEASYTGQMRDRYLMGKWAAYEGLVYPDFTEENNLITREQALAHLAECRKNHVQVRPIEAYDFGLVSPTCYGLGFVDERGRVILLDGFYKAMFPYNLHPDAIWALRGKYFPEVIDWEPIEADPAIFKRNVIAGHKDTGERLSVLLGELGVDMRPASNDIKAGIAKVTSYISGSGLDIPHLITGAPKGPLLYVCQECQWFRDEIFSYYWKRSPLGTSVDEPMDKDDHAMDMIKYMLSHLPEPSEIIVPAHFLPPAWGYWREKEDA